MDWNTYLTVLINLCLTWSIDVIDVAVKAQHFSITLHCLTLPHDPWLTHPTLPSPCFTSAFCSNSQSVQTTSRSCSSTTTPIYWPVEQERLTPSAPWSEWDTRGRWVSGTELEFGLCNNQIFKWYFSGFPLPQIILNCNVARLIGLLIYPGYFLF